MWCLIYLLHPLADNKGGQSLGGLCFSQPIWMLCNIVQNSISTLIILQYFWSYSHGTVMFSHAFYCLLAPGSFLSLPWDVNISKSDNKSNDFVCYATQNRRLYMNITINAPTVCYSTYVHNVFMCTGLSCTLQKWIFEWFLIVKLHYGNKSLRKVPIHVH